jgi:hypothetical protein
MSDSPTPPTPLLPSDPRPVDDMPERTFVQLRFLPGHVPRSVRLRHFLKQAKRQWGLVCEGFSGPDGKALADVEGKPDPPGTTGV